MATLSPPQPNRARSSSIVQPLTIDSTLRRTPAAAQCPLPLDAQAPPTPVTPSNYDELPALPQGSPGLSQLVTLSLKMLPTPRPSPKHEIGQLLTPPSSSESSPRPSFSSVFTRPPPTCLPTPALSPRSLTGYPFPSGVRVPRRTYYAPLVLLTTAFVFSLIPIVFALSTLPITSLKSVPRTVADIAALGKELQAYSSGSSAGMAHVMGVMCCLAIWKHAWSIPGSVVLNVLTGALLSPLWATLLMTWLTTIGSLVATILSAPLSPLVQRFVPKALDVVSVALQGTGGRPGRSRSNPEPDSKRTPTWVRLVVMRLVGVVPWSGINIACGVCRVSFVDCAIGAFIGTLPWTAVTCQIGDILQTLAVSSTSSDPKTLSSLLSSPSIIFKLVVLSVLSLAPVLYRNKLTALLGGSTATAVETISEKPEPVSPRWNVWRWRRDSADSPRRPQSPERRLEEDLDEKAIDSMTL
ncbi:Golgi apparatus membrane protein TVP38 [Ceratobasidium sp. AG-Ba]|nr:Golgi apparatus membrane protein TVP38 [Ceratobasidium sp. AG-Ba]QRW01463.1 Golgi apparatus membrane protein TVP38 [Ceratobasidium sp. AG-Ba]